MENERQEEEETVSVTVAEFCKDVLTRVARLEAKAAISRRRQDEVDVLIVAQQAALKHSLETLKMAVQPRFKRRPPGRGSASNN